MVKQKGGKLLLYSYAFTPGIGGIESATQVLVDGLRSRGYEVRVTTQTRAGGKDQEPNALRTPSHLQLLGLVRWADLVVHSNISLRAAWPLLFLRKPWIIIHHSSLRSGRGTKNRVAALKQWASRFATNISVSRSMASELQAPSYVLGNAYRDEIFYPVPFTPRSDDLIFVGRLVSSKGVDAAIRLLAKVRARGFPTRLTVVGGGPCAESLKELAKQLEIEKHVSFTGALGAAEVATLLNRHKILLVPSRDSETFGLAPLEAIACGCVPVAFSLGGLPESIGECGFMVPPGDFDSMLETVMKLLEDSSLVAGRLKDAEKHVLRYRPQFIVDKYASIIEAVLKESKGARLIEAPVSC
jgi:glycogen synthase